MKQYRQGDILLMELPRVHMPGEAQDQIILATGEATGHKHVLTGRLVSSEYGRVVEVLESLATLSHEDHETIKIPEGVYRVVRQVEWLDGKEIRIGD